MTPRYWAVIPAAGSGQRMRAEMPKQYLPVGGRCVLEHTLEALLGHSRVNGAVVALAAGDPYWERMRLPVDKPVWTAPGGATRADSVLNALKVLRTHAKAGDRVLVHDAARPCVRQVDISTLIEVAGHAVDGGLLALPVGDTMKREADGQVSATVARERLWHALTPQLFALDQLLQALEAAHARGIAVTDDAAAMEAAGFRPHLVQGSADNVKITQPEDLALAEFYLRRQQRL